MCRQNCCRRCSSAARSNRPPACPPGRPAGRLPAAGACGAGWDPCCRRTSNKPASGHTCPSIARPISRGPSTATASLSRNSWPSKPAEALPFVPHPALVGGIGRAGKPAFVDAPTLGPIGIPIARREFDALARMQEAARHPRGGQPQQSRARVQCPLDQAGEPTPLHDGLSGKGCCFRHNSPNTLSMD